VNGVQQAAASTSPQATVDAPSRVAWTQVLLASILMVATLPGRTQGLGLITEPLLADLHLDRVAYASMNLWATLAGALFCFPTGWAIDRVGLRWVAAAVVLLLGITVWQFSIVTGSVALVFSLLLATRAFGQSALSVCSIATVARWFPNRAGFSMGIYSVLLSVFFAVAFGAVGYSIRLNNWRAAWMQIAVALFVIALLAVFASKAPHDGTLSPPLSEPEARRVGDATFRSELTLSQTLRTSAFWVFAGTAAAFNLVSSGLGLFNEAVLNERGFDQKTFHTFLILSASMSLAGQFVCGWLTRRWRYQTITFLALVVYAFGLGFIPLITRHWQLWGLAVLLGVAGGLIIVVFFSVWSDLFGQRHLGRIQGAAQMFTVLSSGVGPLIFAKSAALSGSYSPVLYSLAVISLLLAFVARGVRSPNEVIKANAYL